MSAIASNVGDYLYKGHGRGVFDPERMATTRTSNCFGRLAIIGSVIAHEMPEATISLLIAQNHGMEFQTESGRPARWLAHAEAIIVTDAEAHLLDTTPFTLEANPSLQLISNITYEASESGKIAHHSARDVYLHQNHLSEQEQLRRYGPPAIRACHHIFAMYDFAAGLHAYQQVTANANAREFVARDYVDFYYANIAPEYTPELAISA